MQGEQTRGPIPKRAPEPVDRRSEAELRARRGPREARHRRDPRRHLEPDDHDAGDRDRLGLRRAVQRARRCERAHGGRLLGARARRRDGRPRRPAPALRVLRRRRRFRLGRGRAGARARHGGHHRRRPGAPRPSGATQPAREDPHDTRGPAGDRGGDRRRREDQRDADLLPRALRSGHRRLPQRSRAARRRGRIARLGRLGRLVLREPRRLRGRPPARGDRGLLRGPAGGARSSCAARPPSPRRGSPTRSSTSGSRPLASRPSRRRGHARSARCGRQRRRRTRATPTFSTSTA